MTEEKAIQTGAEAEPDLGALVGRLLRTAKRGRLLIPLVGLAVLLGTVVVLSFVPNVFKSESTILVVEQQIPQNVVAPLSSTSVTFRLQAIAQEVLSKASLLRIIDETKLYAGKNLEPDIAVDVMRKSIGLELKDATRDGGLGSFEISFSAPSPAVAQEVTRRLAALFIERHSEKQVSRANSTEDFFTERLKEKRKRVEELQREIRSLKIRNSADLPENRVANESKAAEYRAQLQNAQMNLNRAKQQRISWESMLTGSLVGRLTRLKNEKSALLIRLTPKHPQVIAKDEEIALMERAVARVQSGQPVSADELARLVPGDPSVSQIEGQLQANQLEIDSAIRDQKRFEVQLADVQRHLGVTPAVEQQLSAMNREAEVLGAEIAKLESLEQQSALSADMEKRQQGEQFRLIEPASLPLKPLSPKRFRIAIGGAAFGLVLGFVGMFVLDLKRGAFHTEEEVRRRFSPPFVLGVPEISTTGELRSRRVRDWLEWAGCAGVLLVTAAIGWYYRHSV